MGLNNELKTQFGSQYSTTEAGAAIDVGNVKLASAQLVWTDDTPAGKRMIINFN